MAITAQQLRDNLYLAIICYIGKQKLWLVPNWTYGTMFKLKDAGDDAPADGSPEWHAHPNPYISEWNAAAIGFAQPSLTTIRNALLMTDITTAKALYNP